MFDDKSIQEIRNGNEQLLTGVYRTYRDEFIRWANRHYQCQEEIAKDIYQVSIVIFYENIMSGKLTELKSSVKTYLFAIGKNKILEQHVAQKKQEKVQENFIYEPIEHIPAEDREEIFLGLEKALSELGEPCRTLLELYYYKNYSIDQIAGALGYKGNDSAKTQKYKCLNRLKKILAEQNFSLNRN
jgi:RNA polymerase sigma factor (sigma-70 family)